MATTGILLTRLKLLGRQPKNAPQVLGASFTEVTRLGGLHVEPPSVDLENMMLALVPPQPVPLLEVQRSQVTYTVPSLPMAKSLNWSTVGNACGESTATGRDQVVPLSTEWDTAMVLLLWGSNCVLERYRVF